MGVGDRPGDSQTTEDGHHSRTDFGTVPVFEKRGEGCVECTLSVMIYLTLPPLFVRVFCPAV